MPQLKNTHTHTPTQIRYHQKVFMLSWRGFSRRINSEKFHKSVMKALSLVMTRHWMWQTVSNDQFSSSYNCMMCLLGREDGIFFSSYKYNNNSWLHTTKRCRFITKCFGPPFSSKQGLAEFFLGELLLIRSTSLNGNTCKLQLCFKNSKKYHFQFVKNCNGIAVTVL